MDEWKTVQEAHTDAVFLVKSQCLSWNHTRPFNRPTDSQSSGSAFCVDRDRGLLVTNSHVVSSATSLTARTTCTGDLDLGLRLLCICPTRDLALLRLTDDAREALGPRLRQVEFGDSDALGLTERVLAAGYPLGQEEVKFTTGVVSGWHMDEDSGLYSNSFVQITAAINPGNSGGPLLNSRGQVVGVNAAGYMFLQSIGYAIPSRVVVPIVRHMLSCSTPILHAPELCTAWTPLNATMTQAFGLSPEQFGVLVTDVLECSSGVDTLRPGDVLTEISFPDPMATAQDLRLDADVAPDERGRPARVLQLDNYGKCTTDAGGLPRLAQKRTLVEALVCLPVDWPITCTVIRKRKSATVRWNWRCMPPRAVREHHSCFERPTYVLFGGMCVSPLSQELVTAYKRKNTSLCTYDRASMRCKDVLLVTRVFPMTSTWQLHTVEEGMVLQSVNTHRVTTLAELQAAVAQSGKYAVVKFKDGPLIVVDVAKDADELAQVRKANQIEGAQLARS